MTKAERGVIIANLGLLVTELYGPRCPDKEAGCVIWIDPLTGRKVEDG
jgi:hypothetical protein